MMCVSASADQSTSDVPGIHEEDPTASKLVAKTVGVEVTVSQKTGNELNAKALLQQKQCQYRSARNTFEEAIAAYNKAIKEAPDDAELYYLKAVTLKNRTELDANTPGWKGKLSYEEALAACKEALKRSPGYVEALYFKGQLLKMSADWQRRNPQEAIETVDKALDAYAAALKLAPDRADIYCSKGQAL